MPDASTLFQLERTRLSLESETLTFLAAGTTNLTDAAQDVAITDNTGVDQSAVAFPTRDLLLTSCQVIIRGAVANSPTGIAWALYEAPNGVGQITPTVTTLFPTEGAAATIQTSGMVALIQLPWIRGSQGASAYGTAGTLYWRGSLDTATATAADADIRIRFCMPSTGTSISPPVT